MLWLTLSLFNGCLTLDQLLPFHSNIPCSDVDESTCEDVNDPWDQVCITCSMDYDWDRVAPWRDRTFVEGESIPTINPDIVEEITIDIEDVALNAHFIPAMEQYQALKTPLLYTITAAMPVSTLSTMCSCFTKWDSTYLFGTIGGMESSRYTRISRLDV